MAAPTGTGKAKKLGFGPLAALIVVYLVTLQIGGLALRVVLDVDADYGKFPDADSLFAGIVIPVAVSLLLVVVVISVLRWWPRILHDPYPVSRWVLVVPIVLALTGFAIVDYGNLGRIETNLVILGIAGSLMVGCAEELMFRGITVTSMRDAGFTETRVALWSSLVFGAVHITNIITEGPTALVQVAIVSVSGFFFYLTMRVTRTIIVGMLLHALWDFSLFSASIGPDAEFYPLSPLAYLANLGLGILLLVRRRKIGVAVAGQSPRTTPA
jgi:membrane protease YdiL (CAAX protease family)